MALLTAVMLLLTAAGVPAQLVDRAAGRVLDPAGRPLVGATVVLVPDGRSLGALGFFLDHTADGEFRRPVAGFARDDSAADGSFELVSQRRDAAWDPSKPLWAEALLLVLHDGHAPLVRPLEAWHAGVRWEGELRLQQSGATLTGHVVDDAGRPVAGARVRVRSRPEWQRDPEAWSETVNTSTVAGELARMELQVRPTAEDGHFELRGLPSGPVVIRVESAGHAPWLRGDVTLSGAAATDLGEIVLPRGRTLEGVVRQASGTPAADATVIVVDGYLPPADDHAELHLASVHTGTVLHDSELRARTVVADGAGRFVARGLASPTVGVVARAPGHEPVMRCAVDPAEPLTLTLVESRAIELEVTDGRGGPPVAGAMLAGAWIEFEGYGDAKGWMPLPEPTVTPMARGLRVRAGCALPVTVAVAAPGHATVVVPLPADAESAEIELPPAVAVLGRVLDAEGRPFAGAELRASRTRRVRDDGFSELEPRMWSMSRSGADGQVQLHDLALGPWDLEVWSAAGSVSLEKVVLGTEDVALGDVRLPRSPGERRGPLTGTVHWRDGEPAEGVQLEACLVGWPVERVRTGIKGRFAFPELPAGPLRLSVRSLPALDAAVEVVPGGGEPIAITLPRGPRVHGRVVRGEMPVPDATLVMTDRDGSRLGLVTGDERSDANGAFVLQPLTNEMFFVRAMTTTGGSSLPRVFSGDREMDWVVDLELGDGALVVRVLDDKDSAPVSGVHLRLRADKPLATAGTAVVTDHSGEAQLRDLVDGTYRLEVHDPQGRHPNLVPGPWTVRGETLAELRLPRAARLEGRASFATGQPAPDGLDVVLRPGGAPGEDIRTRLRDGRFQLSSLAPGSWRLQVGEVSGYHGPSSAWGGDQPWIPVDLAPGETSRVIYTLEPLPEMCR